MAQIDVSKLFCLRDLVNLDAQFLKIDILYLVRET